MPNRDVHRPIGAALGAASGLYATRHMPFEHRAIETLGATVAGYFGAAAPDWFDPATSPNHRHVGHGAANVIGGILVTEETILNLQKRLRHRADLLRGQRQSLMDDWSRLLSWLEESFLRFLAGMLNGFAIGYMSHLFLDALTARGIPLFARGF